MSKGGDHVRPVALVTGAARRIGRAIALELAKAGYDIGVHHRASGEDAELCARELREIGVAAAPIAGDLTQPGAPERIVDLCRSTLGTPVVLVNNASLFSYDRIDVLTSAGLRAHLATNLEGPILLAKAFAERLPATSTGNIVNIIDQRAWRPTPAFFSYSLSKSALWPATRMLAQALAPRIRVNAIGPGPALRSVHQSEAEFAAEEASTILGRGTTPGEVARAVRFILDAPSMTGQMIALDGGQHLTWPHEPEPSTGNATGRRQG